MTPLLDIDLTKANKLFDLNVFAPFAVVKAFISLLIASKGTIVNIGSYVDSLPAPWQGVYNASKAALRSLTDINVVYVRPSQHYFPIQEHF
jgi:1-acylglycerone phosphate reductase